MKLVCECNSFSCTEKISAPLEELHQAKKDDQIIIATSCVCGPEATDALIEKKDGYSIYKEG